MRQTLQYSVTNFNMTVENNFQNYCFMTHWWGFLSPTTTYLCPITENSLFKTVMLLYSQGLHIVNRVLECPHTVLSYKQLNCACLFLTVQCNHQPWTGDIKFLNTYLLFISILQDLPLYSHPTLVSRVNQVAYLCSVHLCTSAMLDSRLSKNLL